MSKTGAINGTSKKGVTPSTSASGSPRGTVGEAIANAIKHSLSSLGKAPPIHFPNVSSDPNINSEPGFDMCPSCGSLVASDVHRLFTFYRSPADIAAEKFEEWRPSDPALTPIPGDQGPGRVAYQWADGSPVVQVHEGDDSGLWTPCYSYTVTLDGLPFSRWVCRRSHVSEPCDEDYMLEIST